MAWSPGVLSVAAFMNTVVFTVLAVASFREHEERYAEEFVALMVVLAGWSLAYSIQLGFNRLAAQLAWWEFALTISGFAPAVGLLFLLRYAGDGYLPDERLSWVILTEPVVFGVLTLTNRAHLLVWTSAGFDPASPVRVPVLTFGPAYYAHVGYVYAVVAAGALLVLIASVRSAGLYRRQTAAMFLGLVPPLVAHLSFTLGVSPVPGLDPTPFVFTISGVFVAVALFRLDLLDRTQIAREQALRTVGDGLVVLDADGTIVDLDERAARVLSPSPCKGEHISSTFPSTPLSRLSGTTIEEAETEAGPERTYELRLSELRDAETRLRGYALLLRDVTNEYVFQQRLKVANRVLRHNLRNDMNVVKGLATRILSGSDENPQDTARQISRKASRVVETSEKVREMTRLDPTDTARGQTVDLATPVDSVVDRTREAWPAATFECDLAPTPAVVADEAALVTALENLLDNAVEHNDRAQPTVRVTTTSQDGTASIFIADDGPGIPVDELEVLRSQTETPLEHSRGLGLWLAYWSARTAGGSLVIEDCDDEGSTVRLDYPTAPA